MHGNHQSKRIGGANRLDDPREISKLFKDIEMTEDSLLKMFMENQLYTAIDYRLKHLRSHNDAEHNATMKSIVEACMEHGYIPMYDATTLPEVNPLSIDSYGSDIYVFGLSGDDDRLDVIASGEMRCITTLGISGLRIERVVISADSSHISLLTVNV